MLDPYFSGTKVAWLLTEGGVPAGPDLAVGTIDTWVLWNLTGGAVHATDPSNASRTMLLDIHALAWDDELAGLLGVPVSALPEVRPTSGRLGVTVDGCGAPAGIPVSSLVGDQQGALFGQACFAPGMSKNTYGTGSFVLTNVGPVPPPVADGMLTTVAWELADGSVAYALEGSIFVTGAAVQWLRDGLGLIESSAEIGPLAASVTTPTARSWSRPSPASGRPGGIRTPGVSWWASPAASPAPTSPAPSWSRWRTRCAMPSRRWPRCRAARSPRSGWTEVPR